MSHRPLFALATGVALAAPPLNGGWVVTTVHELPAQLVVDQPATIMFTIRQHGESPLAGVSPSVLVRPADASFLTMRRRVEATPTGKPGVYRATITATQVGALSVEIDPDFHGWRSPLLDIPVVARVASAANSRTTAPGQALFVAKGCVTCHMKSDDPALAEQRWIAVGPALNGRTYPAGFVAQKVKDPSALRPTLPNNTSAKMPVLEVSAAEAEAIALYLNSRRVASVPR
jgi:mono/diheme cytochrome c family protein